MTINISSHLKINILFFPLLAASILGRYFSAFFAAYLCAIIHELSHIAIAQRLGVGVSYIEILPFGVCARLKADIIKNPVHEILIALSGPLANVILAIASTILFQNYSINNEVFTYFFYCNVAMAAINILPTLPLDGGRILRAYLTLKTGSIFAYNFSIKLSRIVILFLLGCSVYILLASDFNFSLILIGAFLLGNLCLEQRNISKFTLRELLCYPDKINDGEMMVSHILTAHKDTPARRILKKLSYNNYHIVCVVDDDLKILKTLTEGQLISSLQSRGIRITLDEI